MAFQQPTHHARSVFPSQHRNGWQRDVGDRRLDYDCSRGGPLQLKGYESAIKVLVDNAST
jgi:hypothetical protein